MPATLDGNATRTRRTRARILAESLRLFNEKGEARVTTGMIAEALNMSPGNLYYHFRNKDAIVADLFRDFEALIAIELHAPESAAAAMEDLWLYLHLLLERIWEYRFLYRNLDDLLARNFRWRAHFNRIVDAKRAAIVALCDALVDAGSMRATPGEIRTLALNVLVVATYWLNFSSLRDGARGGSADLGVGASQVMALFAPYLVGEARVHLDHLSRHYEN